MSETVFWSWQADLSSKSNRSFIKDALLIALGKVQEELQVEEPDRQVTLDHDTKSAQGMADIAATIFDQVSKASVFVADVTPIAKSNSGKAVPNPNVMIELGYAMHALGPERIIAVLNVGFGTGPESLPFDIRQRRILSYNLPENADATLQKSVRKKLIDDLAKALISNIKKIHKIHLENSEIKMAEEDRERPGLWKGHWPVIHQGLFGEKKSVVAKLVPRATLKVIPANWPSGIPPISMFDDLPSEARLYAPQGGGTSGDQGPFQDGYISYWIPSEKSDYPGISVFNIAAFLEEFGEIWMSDGKIINEKEGKVYISYATLLTNWIRGLDRTHEVLDRLGAGQRRRVVLSVSDLSNTYWPTQIGYVPGINRKPRILTDQTNDFWDADLRKGILRTAWNTLRNAYSQVPMSEVEFDAYYRARK